MSIIVGVRNSEDIVIGWDSLSTYKSVLTGAAITPPEEAQKVIRINPRLAFMITGTYGSDKVRVVKDFVRRMKGVLTLDEAFKDLYHIGDVARLGRGEGFQMGLAGYISGKPTFRFVSRDFGDPHLSYVNEYPLHHYLSGPKEVFEAAEDLIKSRVMSDDTPTADIAEEVRRIVDTCIKDYPEKLGPPTNILILPSQGS